jgi:AcrR family transcriptional regulator
MGSKPEEELADRLLAEWPEVGGPPAARRLLIAATEAFAERGFHATTTRDIAGRAGMSPGGLYVHFESKEELLFRISLVGHERALAVLVEAGAGAGSESPTGRLRALVRDFAAWHALHHTTARVIQYELGALSAPHLAAVVELRRRIDHTVREAIELGVAAGVFDAPDVPGAALAILSLSIDVARWYNAGTRREPEEIGALYADLAVRMLRVVER